jgi:MFS family permease
MVQSARSVAAFWLSVALLVAAFASSAVPSPLYPVYAAQWGLTPLKLTIAFAIYVATLLLTLLTAGSLSDFVGRKPMLIAGTLGVIASLVLFALDAGFGVLLLARAVQGVSVGLLISTLGATLLDHSLASRPTLAGVLNGVAPPAALALGAVVSGALVEWGPHPEQLVFIIFGAALVALVLALPLVPETVRAQPGGLRSLLPAVRVPHSSRRLLLDVTGALIASWALGGLYLSLVPSVLSSIFDVTNHFAAGALIGLFTGVGALSGLLLQRMDPRRQLLVGLVALILGPVVTVTFVVGGWLPGVVVGTAIAGLGFGAGFQSSLRMLVATVAPQHRAGLLSAVFILSYSAFGLPSVIAGLVDPHTGLTAAIVGYGVFVVVAAFVALVLQLIAQNDPAELGAAGA